MLKDLTAYDQPELHAHLIVVISHQSQAPFQHLTGDRVVWLNADVTKQSPHASQKCCKIPLLEAFQAAWAATEFCITSKTIFQAVLSTTSAYLMHPPIFTGLFLGLLSGSRNGKNMFGSTAFSQSLES